MIYIIFWLKKSFLLLYNTDEKMYESERRIMETNLNFVNELKEYISSDVYINESMKKHTTFKVGGNADYFVEVQNIFDLKYIVKTAKEYNIPYYILGNGSNLLVKDNGIRGIVIKMGMKSMDITMKDDFYLLRADAGVMLKDMIQKAGELGIGPVAKLYGIPRKCRWPELL